ncbi:MAG: RNA polymerase sigma factor [Bacteroidales bacterium]|nr:RNA polymerase sigma factor [Bacteroidales bacterium]
MRDELDMEKIIAGCKKGNRAMQKQLFECYSNKMFGVCLTYSRDRTEAEDILHDGFIKVFENINSFKGTGSFEGWIRKIMINTALEHFRKKKKLYVVNDYTVYEQAMISEDFLSTIAAKEIMELVKELSQQYRIVFLLYAVEGYSHREISRRLRISEGTSKSNLSRARAILQQKIKVNYGETAFKTKKISISQ